jgi:hypothetical protein
MWLSELDKTTLAKKIRRCFVLIYLFYVSSNLDQVVSPAHIVEISTTLVYTIFTPWRIEIY